MANSTNSSKKYQVQIDNLLLNVFIEAKSNMAMTHSISILHTHSNMEIFACKQGQVVIMTPEQHICLSAGDIAIVPPNIQHLRTPSTNSETKWTVIGFWITKCSSQNTRNLYKKIEHILDVEKITVYKGSNAFYDILESIKSSTTIDEEPSGIIEFVSELSKLANRIGENKNYTRNISKHASKNIDLLLKFEYFINQEFMTPLTNKKIADSLHIGERQLSRLVMNHYGSTLHTLILQKRISVAAQLLEETTDSIESIALAVGFNNKMNFYRVFNKIYHITPAQYRHKKISN